MYMGDNWRSERLHGPCYKCADRHIGCHSECERYIAFSQECEADRNERVRYIDAVRHKAPKRPKK